jgi:uncharacterized protein involved in exopolysaccharide biosynthesis
MQEEKENAAENFSSIHILALILRHKYFIIITVILATTTAGLIAFKYLQNQYKSTVNVVPPQSSSGMDGTMGMISSTLKDIGLNKLAGKAGGADSYNFMVILMSRSVLDSLIYEFDLVKTYNIKDSSISDTRKELESRIEISFEKDGNYFISVWDENKELAPKIANRMVDIANAVAIRIFREEVKLNRENMEKRLKSTDSTIHAIADTIENFSRRTLIFSPTEQASSMSKALSDLKSEEMKYDIMHEYYKSIYGENDYMTQAVQNIRNQTAIKVKESIDNPGFAGNFAIKDAAEEGIEFLRLYTEFETFSKVKAFMLPMMEQTRMDEAKKIKNLIVVDKAVPAEKKDRPKRSLIVAGTFLGSFIFSIFMILMFYSVSSLKIKLKQLSND